MSNFGKLHLSIINCLNFNLWVYCMEIRFKNVHDIKSSILSVEDLVVSEYRTFFDNQYSGQI